MAKDDQPLEFLFDPMRFLNDEQVRTMRPAELGAYTALFCNGWTQPEPGVLEDDDRLLALLARCTPEEWAAVRARVARCYDLNSRPGFWVQRGTVATAALRRSKLHQAREAGKKGAHTRWQPLGIESTFGTRPQGGGVRIAPPQATLELTREGDPIPVGLGVVGLGMEIQPPNGDVLEVSSDPLAMAQWLELFEPYFWNEWPVGFKVGRLDCEAIWRKIRPRSLPMAERIRAGVHRSRGSERWAKPDPNTGKPGAFIPNPKTWLRQGRWDDDLAPATASDGVGWARRLEGGST